MALFKELKKAVKKVYNTTGLGGAIKAIDKVTGGKEKRKAKNEAERITAESKAATEELQRKTAKEKAKANRIAARGLRSRRAASYLASSDESGSATIG